MTNKNKTERWVEEFDKKFYDSPAKGIRTVDVSTDDYKASHFVSTKEIKSFISQLLSDARREANAKGFKKGYIKGALDKKWGQTTADEEIEKIRREERERCLEAINKLDDDYRFGLCKPDVIETTEQLQIDSQQEINEYWGNQVRYNAKESIKNLK